MTAITQVMLTRYTGTIVLDPIENRADRAIVFLDGIQSSGVTPGTDVTAFLLKYGDFVDVRYPEMFGFSGKRAAREILDEIQHYEEILFVGLSLGGLLAYDIIALAKQRKLNISFGFVPISAPTGTGDLKNPLAKIAPFIPPIPVPRIITRKFLFGNDYPDHDPSLSDTCKEELDLHEQISRDYPFGPWIRQVAYIAGHRELDEEVLEGVPTIYMRTKTDPYVRRRAHTSWGAAHWSGPLREVVIDLDGHCNMLAYPELWIAGLKEVFDKMGLAPLED